MAVSRCEDAPACGHVECGFGPGVPGYGSMVNGLPYYGERLDGMLAGVVEIVSTQQQGDALVAAMKYREPDQHEGERDNARHRRVDRAGDGADQ